MENSGSGNCIRDALIAIGIPNQLPPYASFEMLRQLTSQYIYIDDDRHTLIVSPELNLLKGFVYLDVKQRHATAVQFGVLSAFKDYLYKNNFMVAVKE